MIKPYLDYVLGKEIKTDNGIVSSSDIEDTIQKYEVLAIGNGRYELGEFIVPEVKPGDIVFVQKHSEADTPKELKEQGLALFMNSRIIAVEKN